LITASLRTGATGLAGPVALCGGLVLLLAAPWARGGNRQWALVALEAAGLAILLALVVAYLWIQQKHRRVTLPAAVAIGLACSPAILAVLYLTPLPAHWWASIPGRALYLQALDETGIAVPARLALSISPDATRASLLAGIPIAAAFLLGSLVRLRQLRPAVWLVVGLAMAQVLVALLQIAGGAGSTFYFGAQSTRPVGTFGNSNHLANYLAMALAAYVWLAVDDWQRRWPDGRAPAGLAASGTALWWGAGGVVLVGGILLSQSRGALLTGLPAALLALVVATGAVRGHAWRWMALAGAAVVLGAFLMFGLDATLARFRPGELGDSASFRTAIARTTLAGAAEFWPWGAGWGTFGDAYPRFKPLAVPGTTLYAHQDYAQMLFEGGMLAVVLTGAFVWLAVARAVRLASQVRDRHTLASMVCGFGVLGMLLHSMIDFSMHIPANAILAALLAGVYLRPFDSRDRPA
jgi:O-antigen ligase